jgi:hypothetical protein
MGALLVLAATACSSSWAERSNSATDPVASQSSSPSHVKSAPTQATASASPSGPIRKVDFKNFTYPWYPSDYTPPHGDRKITLRDGEMKVDAVKNIDRLRAGLPNVSYADLTGDGQEEAIVTVVTNFDPNGSVACIFVYT